MGGDYGKIKAFFKFPNLDCVLFGVNYGFFHHLFLDYGGEPSFEK